jgi:hypothetical protein
MHPEWALVFVMAWSIDASRVAAVWGTNLLGVAETENGFFLEVIATELISVR